MTLQETITLTIKEYHVVSANMKISFNQIQGAIRKLKSTRGVGIDKNNNEVLRLSRIKP